MSELTQRNCRPKAPKLSVEQRRALTPQVPLWVETADGLALTRSYDFKNFYRTMAFVNAVASVAHAEDHHPDMNVSYARVVVSYSTHDAGGLTENDFICAAKLDALHRA
jgi:4a-hydroxytetrahydrobiopterin dehydratase